MNINISELSVHFTLKKVLTNLNVSFKEKELHAILGENGAGKSTLAKVLSGELKPGKGHIFLDQEEVHLPDAKSAIKKGICHVHQRPILAESISVKENLLLGIHKIDKIQFKNLCELWLKDLSLNKKVGDTSSDQRFFIALTGALLKNPKLLILDEPSALLDKNQRTFLFLNLQKLAAEGMNIIIITHDLEEALNFCNTITVLKDGEVLKTFSAKQTNEEELNEILFPENKNDREKLSLFSHKSEKESDTSLEKIADKNETSSQKPKKTDHLSLSFEKLTAQPLNKPALFNLNFTAESGQITLIQGLFESGLNTLEEIITGIDSSKCKGSVTLKDESEKKVLFSCSLKKGRYNSRTLRNKMGIRIGIIPTDRTFTGSNPNLTIEDILTTAESNDQTLISKAEINITAKEKVSNLSGGMLQRLIFARETDSSPELLILCEPLQGLDRQACENLCKKVKDFAQKNMMIIVLSSTPFPEELCKRIYYLNSGYFSKEVK
ncbi:MAG: ATP-binding cassette domain-containing protein [Treponema sp.]|nr:ATP-binding cassette domain-containing protein [Treponema sp.]